MAATLLALAVPGASLAQSAGDQQYADPLAQPQNDGDQPDSQPDQGSQGNSGSTGNQTPATPSDSGQAQTDQQPQAQAAQGTAELPRTGYPAWLAALAGGVLLASGAALRLRT